MTLNNKKKIVALFLATCGVYGVVCEVSITSQSNNLLGDMLFLPCIYLLYHIYLKSLKLSQNQSFYILNISLSILFSVFLILGAQLDIFTDFRFSLLNLIAILCLTCAIYPILSGITVYLDKYNSTERVTELNRRVTIICMVIISIVWLISYLAMFPGVYGVDAHTWHYQYSRQDIPISSQWSVVYSGVFYWFVEFGYNYFNSYEIGFGILSFIQISYTLWVIWNILDFLQKIVNNKAVVIGGAFFTLLPSHIILSVTSVQDALFSAIFAFCLIQLFYIAKDAGGYFKRKRNCVRLTFNLILLCMIRNNGIYAIFILCLFVAFLGKQCKAKIISVLIVAISIVMVYQGPVYNAIGIQKGTAIREMLSLPLQQMAYVYNYEMHKLSDDVKEEMLEYVTEEGWRSYQWCISDQVKSRLNIDYTKNNFMKFVMLYIKIGMKAPMGYLKSGLLQDLGFWYPNKVYTDYRIWHPYLNYVCFDSSGVYGDDFTIYRDSKIPIYDKLLAWLFGKGDDYSGYGGNLTANFSKIPVMSVLTKPGIYSWAIMYIVGYYLYKKWRMPFIVIGFVIGIWITVLLSPVILYRYMAPIIFSAPVFVSTVFVKWDIR